MSAKTSIEWTDMTWNPVRGCSRVSPGCDHCYAEGIAARFSGTGRPYEGLAKMVHGRPHWTGKIQLVESALTEPLRWKKPRRVFVNSMSDLFHEGVPTGFLHKVFGTMLLCQGTVKGYARHTFQPLTKRPLRMEAELSHPDFWGYVARDINNHFKARRIQTEAVANTEAPSNIWLGFSAENQAAFDERWPAMRRLAAQGWIIFLSAEPLLGPIVLPPEFLALGNRAQVIVGGESGPGARPMHPDWARALRDQCVAAGVPFFFKQCGEWAPVGPIYSDNDTPEHLAALDAGPGDRLIGPSGFDWTHEQAQPNENAWVMRRVGKKRAGRVLDGRTWDQMPGEGAE